MADAKRKSRRFGPKPGHGGRPRIYERTAILHIVTDARIVEELRARAEAKGVSFAGLVTQLLRDAMGVRRGKKRE